MDPLTQILQQCVDEVDALSYFDDIATLTEDSGDLLNDIQKALGILMGQGGKIGAFVLIAVAAQSMHTSIPAPQR